jgi:metal-responsive CopG/Arc/MetJ family transcriptional regulator
MREGEDTEEIDQNERLFSLNEIMAETENVDCDETISEGDRSKLLREIDRELLSEYERNQIVRNCARIVEFTSDDDQDCESIFETIVQCMEE